MIIGPLSPSHLWITTINVTTLKVNWIPNYLWRGYPVDHYNIKILDIDTMMTTAVLFNSTVLENTMDNVVYYHRNNSQLCTEFNFSVTAVSMYGESDPTFIIGGFDEGIVIHSSIR